MKTLVKLLMLLSLGAVICLPGMASADWYLTDTGYYDNYPAAAPPATGPPIDRIVAAITSGAIDFTSSGPGMIDYGGGFSGWTAINTSNKLVEATNSSSPGYAWWNYQFAGSGPIYPFTLDWNAYNGGTFVVHEHIVFDSSGGISGSYDAIPAAIPLPPTLLLLCTGLLGLIGLRRKPRRGNSDDSIK